MRNYRSMPLQLPRGVARFNRRVTNPIQRTYAWLLPPWAIVVHRGRRSGRTYRTPVNAFKRGNTLGIVVLYGERSDWVQNVLAGDAQIVRGGRTYDLVGPRIIDPGASGALPPAAARIGRLSGKVLVGTLGPAASGFGTGPSAD